MFLHVQKLLLTFFSPVFDSSDMLTCNLVVFVEQSSFAPLIHLWYIALWLFDWPSDGLGFFCHKWQMCSPAVSGNLSSVHVDRLNHFAQVLLCTVQNCHCHFPLIHCPLMDFVVHGRLAWSKLIWSYMVIKWYVCMFILLLWLWLFVAEVNKHLANEQNRAAIKIQAKWKGYCTRRGITSRRHNAERTCAAVTIQRMVTLLFYRFVLSVVFVNLCNESVII